jgi:hypothetical protein
MKQNIPALLYKDKSLPFLPLHPEADIPFISITVSEIAQAGIH